MNGTSPPVTFVYSDWIAQFPTFSAIGSGLATAYFNRATFLCSNSGCNPTNCVPGMLSNLLYLLTAHIAWLNAPRDANGNPAATGSNPSPIVGRIDQASEGSVSVHADMGEANAGSPSQAWYMQTTWGSEFWYASAGVRTARYVGPGFCLPGQPGYWPGWARGGFFGGIY
jgi:hypothetical protein